MKLIFFKNFIFSVNIYLNSYSEKPSEASLFIFSVSTGCRAISVYNVLLENITGVLISDEKVFINVVINVTKGRRDWGHTVTVEGKTTNASPTNIFYWLNAHLIKTHSLSLNSFPWDLTPEQAKTHLWPYTTETMRTRLKEAAYKAGYPRDLFCFHSLRSGFICSALIRNGLSNNHRGVFEHTGIIADWKINGRAQLRYIKNVAKRTLCASRLVATSSDDLEEEVIPHELISTEQFHSIQLGPVLWKRENEMIQVFNRDMKAHLCERGVLEKNSEGLFRLAIVRFVKSNTLLRNRARSKRHKTNLFNERRRIGRNFLLNKLTLQNVEEYITAISLFITQDDIDKQNTQTSTKALAEPRKRVRWTTEEESILEEGLRLKMTWKEISIQLPGRSNVDCKDKYRNIQKKKARNQ